MEKKSYDVAVIGAGIVGVRTAGKATEAGMKVVVIEGNNIGHGASGNNHGDLHSGVRYAVKEPATAKECFEANVALRRNPMLEDAINFTGGLVLAVNSDEEVYSQELFTACAKTGLPIIEMKLDEVLKQEKNLTPKLRRALWVPDGYIDGKKVLDINKKAAEESGAEFKLQHEVIGFHKNGDRIEALQIKDKSGQESDISVGFVINAAGAWAGRVGRLAGVNVPLEKQKGSILVLPKVSDRVLNRARMPADGDIFVPAGDYSLLGTTSIRTDYIDKPKVTDEEREKLLLEGEQLIPDLRARGIIREYAGVRPLAGPKTHDANKRDGSRAPAVINHRKDGVDNLVSVVLGKFILYERVADETLWTMARNQLS